MKKLAVALLGLSLLAPGVVMANAGRPKKDKEELKQQKVPPVKTKAPDQKTKTGQQSKSQD